MTVERRPDSTSTAVTDSRYKKSKNHEGEFFRFRVRVRRGGGGDERVSTIAAEKKGAWPSPKIQKQAAFGMTSVASQIVVGHGIIWESAQCL